MINRENLLATILNSLPFSRGAIAGAAGTIPMTAFMLIMHRMLPDWQRYALPPEKTTEEVADRADVAIDKPQLLGASLVSHFGYGASMGSLYSTFTRKIPLPAALKGALFGLVIWGVSYLGWMPAAKFPTAATEEPARRNLLMIVAHVIWGAVTGMVVDLLE